MVFIWRGMRLADSGRHAGRYLTKGEPMNNEDALREALILAITAPKDKTAEAVELVEQIAGRMSRKQVQKCLLEIESMLND